MLENEVLINDEEKNDIEDAVEIKEGENPLQDGIFSEEDLKQIQDFNETMEKFENGDFLSEAIDKLDLKDSGFEKEDIMKVLSGDKNSYNEVIIKGMNNEMGKFLNEHKELITLLFTPATDDIDIIEQAVRIKYDNVDYILKKEYTRPEVTVKKSSNENDLGYTEKSFFLADEEKIREVIMENKELFGDKDNTKIILEILSALRTYEEFTRTKFLETYLSESDYSLYDEILDFDKFKEIYDASDKNEKNVSLGYHITRLEKKIYKLFGNSKKSNLSNQSRIIVDLIKILFKDLIKVRTMIKLITEKLNPGTSVNVFTIEIWFSMLIDYLNSKDLDEENMDDYEKEYMKFLKSKNIENSLIMNFYNNVNML